MKRSEFSAYAGGKYHIREEAGEAADPVYRDTKVPGLRKKIAGKTPVRRTGRPSTDNETFPAASAGRKTDHTGRAAARPDTSVSVRKYQNAYKKPDVPEKIMRMRALYEYRGSSFAEKCRNFYIQGRFMEDYEDDAPWEGNIKYYFTTYHDLNIPQLRGYFTWRTRARKGDFRPVPFSFAYMYLYELLCGIGADSPEDSLRKMKEFETEFLDAGMGSALMRRNLHHWMFGFALIKGLDEKTLQKYSDPEELKLDRALMTLRNPEGYSDEEIFAALSSLEEKSVGKALTVRKDPEKGKQLFAALWRTASRRYNLRGRDLFRICFGIQNSFPYRPLVNAVFWEEQPAEDCVRKVDPVREYICRNGLWKMKRYDRVYFNRKMLQALIREGDRVFRKYLKAGHYLQKREEEGWVTPFAVSAVEAVKKAGTEAARPEIRIDFSGLDKIRRDAAVTREALLTEEETEGLSKNREVPATEEEAEKPATINGTCMAEERAGRRSGTPENADLPDADSIDPAQKRNRFLRALLAGEPAEESLKAEHLILSVVTDEINEALFDEIGDNVLECDGSRITIIEDYREDLARLVGGVDS